LVKALSGYAGLAATCVGACGVDGLRHRRLPVAERVRCGSFHGQSPPATAQACILRASPTIPTGLARAIGKPPTMLACAGVHPVSRAALCLRDLRILGLRVSMRDISTGVLPDLGKGRDEQANLCTRPGHSDGLGIANGG
ncbi:MAG: hypothetical protein OXI86_15240, partial [Candidatus Poribacteria bacterium]|nr:hypothetical protein [Candidatus Poribacteria bacterium]